MAAIESHATPRRWHKTVFWKVAGVLVGVQVLIGLLAVGLSAYFAYDKSLDLVENSLRLRLDGLADEVERRVPDLSLGLSDLPAPLVNDLATRFPDPISIVDTDGQVLVTIRPDPAVFEEFGHVLPPDEVLRSASEKSRMGDIHVSVADGHGPTFGAAPVLDAAGFAVGMVIVAPLDHSIRRELAATRAAFSRALVVVTMIAGLAALVIGGVLTWRIIRPLRSMTDQVERIGHGEYEARLPARRSDEFGRLADSINRMAEQTQKSFETLKATDRLRRDLVANIGHDLRTPLAAMKGFVEEAARHLGSARHASAADALDSAERQVDYITRLVEDLFELAILDSPQPPLRLEPVPIGELVQHAVDAQRALFEKENTHLAVSIAEGLPVVSADGVRLQRLLTNLLDNARKHASSGGRVGVEASVEGSTVRVEVSDSGPGMTTAVRDHVFDRFYRGSGPRTRLEKGTGLGLAISQAIAEAHGGQIVVSSEVGKGSSFAFCLPVRRSERNEKSPTG